MTSRMQLYYQTENQSMRSILIFLVCLSEIEWSSWSDCYVVSKGKKLHPSYSTSSKSRASYSKCGIQKFSGRQYRTSRCMDNGLMEECIAAGKEHKRQTRKCTPSCIEKFVDSKPPPRYLYEKSFIVEKEKNREKTKQHLMRSEDYELVTIGDVEEVKRRRIQKSNWKHEDDTKDQKTSHSLNINSQDVSRQKPNQILHTHNSHIKEHDQTRRNLTKISIAHKNDLPMKDGKDKTQGMCSIRFQYLV